MITFPDYDYPWQGGTDAAQAEAQAQIDASAGTQNPAPELTPGVVFNDLTEGVKTTAKGAGGAIADTFSGAVNAVKSTVRNTYFYLVGGIAIIAILAILIMGMGARFMRTMEGPLR